MDQIPSEIWESMALNGWVSLKDMIALTHTTRSLRSLVRLDGLWNALMEKEKWQMLREDYGIERKESSINSMSAFEEAVAHFQKQRKFQQLVQTYHFGDKKVILSMLDEYGSDSNTLPIVRATMDSLLASLKEEIGRRGRHDISKLALCINIVLTRHSTLALERLLYEEEEGGGNSSDDLERTYFHLSLFDKASYQLIHHRALVLSLIARKISDHINSYSSQLTDVQVYRDELVFSKTSTYFRFLNILVQIVFSTISSGNPFLNNEVQTSYNPTAEDFSILRIYGKQAKGYYLVLYSILAKCLKGNVFNKYKITVEDLNTSQMVQVSVCNRIVKFGEHGFLYGDINDPSAGGFFVKISEFPDILPESSFFPYTGAITEFIKSRASYNNYITDDREFFFGNNRSLGNLICINNEQYRMMQAIVGAAMGATGKFDPVDNDVLLEKKCFVYADGILGVLSNRRISSRYKYACTALYKSLLEGWDATGIKDAMETVIGNVIPTPMSFGRKVGQILGATNSWTIGIVIGYHPHDRDYLCLYTTSGSFEFFKDDASSLVTIDHLLNANHEIVQYFLDVCGVDVLGMCYFESFKTEATSVSFNPLPIGKHY